MGRVVPDRLWFVLALAAASIVSLGAAVYMYDRGANALAPSPGVEELGEAVVTAQKKVAAVAESSPVPNEGDAADDPAIWIHPQSPALSTVIGTDKDGGIVVYDLSGALIQYRADGRINNVDLRSGFRLGLGAVTLVAASDRSSKSVLLYRVDVVTRRLLPVAAAEEIDPGYNPYGLCMYRSPSGVFFVFVTSKDGDVTQFRLAARPGGTVAGTVARRLVVGSRAEGCVTDDDLGHLYVAEEDVGIWRYGAGPSAGDTRVLVDRTGVEGALDDDVEGLAIAYGPGEGYLIASSQGDDTFAVYERRPPNPYVGSFSIEADVVDEVTDTDGIDVTAASLGELFPGGLFVAHDGENDVGNQSFKLVPWDAVLDWLGRKGD